MHERFRKVAAADTGLIGHHDQPEVRLRSSAESRLPRRETYENGGMIQVADFFGDGSVTIQKNGVARRAGIRHRCTSIVESQGRTAASTMSGVTLVMHR